MADLKLRKPERRWRGGLKPRNPHGLDSRREREGERAPMAMVRGAHMDREERGGRGQEREGQP